MNKKSIKLSLSSIGDRQSDQFEAIHAMLNPLGNIVERNSSHCENYTEKRLKPVKIRTRRKLSRWVDISVVMVW